MDLVLYIGLCVGVGSFASEIVKTIVKIVVEYIKSWFSHRNSMMAEERKFTKERDKEKKDAMVKTLVLANNIRLAVYELHASYMVGKKMGHVPPHEPFEDLKKLNTEWSNMAMVMHTYAVGLEIRVMMLHVEVCVTALKLSYKKQNLSSLDGRLADFMDAYNLYIKKIGAEVKNLNS